MRKPITEVLAIVHAQHMGMSWNGMGPGAQALHLSAMAEVVRTLELFNFFVVERDGGLAVTREPPPRPLEPPKIESTSTGYSAAEQAQAMGFTGIPCSRCGSPNTIRIGTCLQCHNPACMHSGECG